MKTFARLLEQFIPRSYNIQLDISHRTERVFSGKVTIVGTLPKAGNAIKLHAKELEILQATIDGVGAGASVSKDDDTFSLTSNIPLSAGGHTVEIEFAGKISDPMHGLYPSYFKLNGQPEEILATQFESHHAREVFPCIDEPAAKAIFNLTLTTENSITVLANTPVKEQKEADNKLVTTFETSPIMSTYLLAFVAGKLGYTEAKTKGDVAVRVYATPDKVAQTEFALDVAVRTLEFYNEYFDIPYPLPKCDMVALPDFSSGAMENWGCITYRESCLLVDRNSATAVKQYAASVIAHELAHQWFGNLVTMEWWNDLWLNESFATWVSFLACDHLFPEWDVWTQFFTDESMPAFRRDGLASVQCVQQEVHDPEEIRTLFDSAIVYAKGANLLNMLHGYIGETAFQNGLRTYLARHKYGNTKTTDLWQALSEAANKDVGAFMQPWTSQPGHPVVDVAIGANDATLTQQRFYNSPESPESGTLWPIPLLSDRALNEELLSERSKAVVIGKTAKPLLLNRGRTGFYHTAYSKEHTIRLAAEVKAGKMPVIDRLGLLSDSLNLSRAGKQSALQMLQLLEAYTDESSEPVWSAMTAGLGSIKMIISEEDSLKHLLKHFAAELARAQFERLGWARIDGESNQDELLRSTVIGIMCYSAEQNIIEYAQDLFANAKLPEDILSDIRGIIFATVAKHGGKDEFDKMLGWYKNTTSAEERINLTAGICSFKQPELIKLAIELLTTKTVKLQDLSYWFAYLMRNRHSRAATWQWMQDNWAWITKNFSSDMHYNGFPRNAAGAFSTKEQLDMYKKFFEPLLSVTALERTIRQGIEDIESRIKWRERDLKDVTDYLQNQ